MRRALAVAAAAAASLLAGAAPAGATNECRGLQVCVPVAGPWVVVPTAASVPRPRVEYELRCPRGYIVGGLDAELSHRSIDVAFLATLGSPVNPGISTSQAAVFVGTDTGSAVLTPSFRPRIGCIPTSGGGGRALTSRAAYPPGKPAVRRVKTLRPRAGRTERAVHGCGPGERLIAASHAVGFRTAAPPSARLVRSVSVERSLRGERIAVAVAAGAALRGIRAEVQVHAVCAGGGQ